MRLGATARTMTSTSQITAYVRDHLKPRHLRLVLALDEYRSISKVAQALNITQPAVSKALIELEAGLGLPLFMRLNRVLEPTQYGKCLVLCAATILAEFENVGEAILRVMDNDVQQLKLGVLPGTFIAVLPRAMSLFSRRSPLARTTIVTGAMDELFRSLLNGQLDLVLGMTVDRPYPQGVDAIPLYEESFMLVVGAHSDLSRRTWQQAKDLSDALWVLPKKGLRFRGIIDRLLEACGITPRASIIEVASHELMFFMLREMDAAAIVSNHNARMFAQMGFVKILPFALPEEHVTVCAYIPGNKPTSSSVRSLIRCVKETTAQ